MKLTRADVLAMPAGREMDAAIAVHLLGWRYCYSPNPLHGYECILCPPEEADTFKAECVSTKAEVFGRPLYRQSMPRHSEDIAAAWQVLAAMAPYGADWQIKYDPCGWGTVTFHQWCGGEDDGKWAEFTAGFERLDQVPLAICRAALLAQCED